MDKQSGNSDKSAPVISHEEIHANVPSISKNISDQDHAYYSRNTNQPDIDTSSANVVMKDKKEKAKKPKDFVILSCFVILGANFIFGFLGYYFGQKSSYAWQLGDVDTAKKQARKALIFNVIGIFIGILTYILAIVLFFTVFKGEVPLVKHHAVGWENSQDFSSESIIQKHPCIFLFPVNNCDKKRSKNMQTILKSIFVGKENPIYKLVHFLKKNIKIPNKLHILHFGNWILMIY